LQFGTPLFDHLVCKRQQFIRDGKPKCLGSFEVEVQYELRWLQHWQGRRTGTTENLPRVDTSLSISIGDVRAIAQQTARFDKLTLSNWQVGSGQNGAQQCPLWVKSRHRRAFRQCPLYPQMRTLKLSRVMSALCQQQTLQHVRAICGTEKRTLVNEVIMAAEGPQSKLLSDQEEQVVDHPAGVLSTPENNQIRRP
jgi:hypothetical protein